MNLPEGTHLAYTLTHEAWYAKSRGTDQPEIHVSLTAEDGCGSDWGFSVERVQFQGTLGSALKLTIFDDAFAAFGQVPEFFAALPGMSTLTEIEAFLDGLGAADATDRTGPARRERMPTFSLQEIRAGAGWPRGARFTLVAEEGQR